MRVTVLPGAGPASLRDQPLAGLPALAHVEAAVAGLTGGDIGPMVLVAGDAPLLRPATIDALIGRHTESGQPVTQVAPATSQSHDWLEEHCRAGVADLAPVACVLDPEPAGLALAAAGTGPADPMARAMEAVRAAGWEIGELPIADWHDALRVTDPIGLALAARVLRDRINYHWLAAGVLLTDPGTTWIDMTARLEPGAVIGPRSHLTGATTVAAGARVGPDAWLHDTTVGAAAQIRYAVCERAEIGLDTMVGPYTYLRAGSRLGPGAGAGCFVEMKGTVVGADTMVPHFACLIDGDIGERCNIAAFTGLANFDGVAKHRAVVGDDVQVAAGTAVMAPARLGDGAVTAAGTVVTKDVPPGALAIARVSQVNVDGWVESRMPGSRSAEAARRAQAMSELASESVVEPMREAQAERSEAVR